MARQVFFTHRVQDFLRREAGAVTVDWTVLAASVVGLGVASVGAVRVGTASLGSSAATSLSGASVANLSGQNQALNGGFLPTGFAYTAGYYWNTTNHLEGWEVLSPLGQRVDIGSGPYFGWTGNHLAADAYFLDFVGVPGDRLEIAQTLNVPSGQTATLRFDLGAHVPQSGVTVYWGNQVLATFNSANTPYQRFETFTYTLQGGAGDGSNQLRFRGTDGQGYTGSLLANVEVY